MIGLWERVGGVKIFFKKVDGAVGDIKRKI